MKRIFTAILLTITTLTSLYAQEAVKDSMTREQFVHSQTIRSDTLNQQALKLAGPGASQADLKQAINLIMSGLHTYAKFRDTVGLRETFDHLALVYHLQKKYIQAKWFYIQSNTFARQLKDTTNIINSLISLSRVKVDIKDYELAKRDLDEALSLSKHMPGINQQIIVQNALAAFYTQTGDTNKAAMATRRITFLKDSVAKKNAVITTTVVKRTTVTTIKVAPPQKTNNSLTITVIIIGIFVLLLIIVYLRKKRNNDAPNRY